MLSSTDILHQRLDLLESTYIGSAAGQGGSSNHSLIERVQALNARFSCLQEETPVFLACYDTAMKLRPLILEKKATVLDISQKVEGLIASKEVLQSNMKMILNIDDLCSKQRNEDLKG